MTGVSADRIVAEGKDGKQIEISEDSQRLFATMLMRLTEMAMTAGLKDGEEGLAAFHAAMEYLSTSKRPDVASKRIAELVAWAESCGVGTV